MCILALLSMIVLLWIGTGKGRAGASPRPTVGDEILLLLSKSDKHIQLKYFIR